MPSVDVEICPASEVDRAAIADLFVDAFNGPPWNDEWTAESARERVSDIMDAPGATGHVAFADGSACGFLLGRIERWYSGDLYYLQEMGVDPERRRAGIGTALLTRLTVALRERDVRRVYLLTMRDSPAASFYRANGFRVDRETQLRYRPL